MEFNTSKLVQNELKSYGIEVRKGFAKTGVIGILKGDLLARYGIKSRHGCLAHRRKINLSPAKSKSTISG